jgi:hypothetical protein
MKTKRKKKEKDFFELTPEERDREVARFDHPIDEKEIRPLTPRERARFERALAMRPRMTVHIQDGARDVVVHLDEELLSRAAAFAKKNKTTLPKMIDRGLRGLLSFAES